MYTVTNRINVKKGFGEKMAPMFVKPGPLQEFDGFHKVEVQVCTTFEEFDELNVVMYWDDLKNFEAWRESDAFKQAHKRPENGQPDPNSPVISSQVVVATLAGTIVKA